MPDLCAEIVDDSPDHAQEADLQRVIERHQQCLEMTEQALGQAATDTSRLTLATICAFHRRRLDELSQRAAQVTAGFRATA
jgi:hypothetical protein